MHHAQGCRRLRWPQCISRSMLLKFVVLHLIFYQIVSDNNAKKSSSYGRTIVTIINNCCTLCLHSSQTDICLLCKCQTQWVQIQVPDRWHRHGYRAPAAIAFLEKPLWSVCSKQHCVSATTGAWTSGIIVGSFPEDSGQQKLM